MAQVPDRIIITFEYTSYQQPVVPNNNFDAANSLYAFLDAPPKLANRFDGDVDLASASIHPGSSPPNNPPATVTVVITDVTSIKNFVNAKDHLLAAD